MSHKFSNIFSNYFGPLELNIWRETGGTKTKACLLWSALQKLSNDPKQSILCFLLEENLNTKFNFLKTTAIYTYFQSNFSPQRQEGKSKLSCDMVHMCRLILLTCFTGQLVVSASLLENHCNIFFQREFCKSFFLVFF